MEALVFFLTIVLNTVIIFCWVLLAGIGIYIGMYLGERITNWLIARKEKTSEKLHGSAKADVHSVLWESPTLT
ncbi:MAG: hypothetical protein M0R80_26430 [Proteobacteria bacterium]|jgi:hypothetical protein|nr:hypothetical protein [Pseudomonadota bacterium]